MLFYAGIGSRSTPPEICEKFTHIAMMLEKHCYGLRSGGAEGADFAFERGVNHKEILRPRHATPKAMSYAASIHPAWHMCNEAARKLHGRNVQIVLGENLDSPVEFVLCWTLSPDRGGTRTGMMVAQQLSIPVFNFAVPGEEDRFHEWFEARTLERQKHN